MPNTASAGERSDRPVQRLISRNCNRLIEAGESGLTTPETANLEDHRREITRLAADNDSKDLQVKRLQEELDRKSQELTDIAKRIEQAEQRLNARAKVGASVDAQAKLAERINRLGNRESHAYGRESPLATAIGKQQGRCG